MITRSNGQQVLPRRPSIGSAFGSAIGSHAIEWHLEERAAARDPPATASD
jgi:hypothetical protein